MAKPTKTYLGIRLKEETSSLLDVRKSEHPELTKNAVAAAALSFGLQNPESLPKSNTIVFSPSSIGSKAIKRICKENNVTSTEALELALTSFFLKCSPSNK